MYTQSRDELAEVERYRSSLYGLSPNHLLVNSIVPSVAVGSNRMNERGSREQALSVFESADAIAWADGSNNGMASYVHFGITYLSQDIRNHFFVCILQNHIHMPFISINEPSQTHQKANPRSSMTFDLR